MSQSEKSNPKLAAICINGSILSTVANHVVCKFVVILNPELSGTQIVLGRYFMAYIATLLYVRTDLKKVMFDQVSRDMIPYLAMKCILGIVMRTFEIIAVKYF